jgi:hypothetical protein
MAKSSRMRVRKLLLTLALLGAVGAHQPLAAAAGQGELVVRGSGNVGIDVVLRQKSTVDLRGFLPDRRAAYSGVVLRDAWGRQLGTAIQVHRWTTFAHAPVPLVTLVGPLTLAPGRYRIELLASGPATIRVPATGSLVRTVAPVRATQSRVTLTDLGAGGVPASNQRYPGVRITPTGAAMLVFFKRATAHQASVPQLCFAAPAAPTCVQAYGFTAVLASPGSVGDGWVQSFTAIYGGEGVDGTYDALVQDVTVDVPAGMDALLVQV